MFGEKSVFSIFNEFEFTGHTKQQYWLTRVVVQLVPLKQDLQFEYFRLKNIIERKESHQRWSVFRHKLNIDKVNEYSVPITW